MLLLSNELVTHILGTSECCRTLGLAAMVCSGWSRLTRASCLQHKFGLDIQLCKHASKLATPTTLRSRHSAAVNALSLSADLRLASASDDKTIVIGAAADEHLLCLENPDHDHGFSAEVYSVVFDNSGSFLYSASSDSCHVHEWDAATGKPIRTLEGHTGYVNTLAMTHSNILFSGSADHDIRRWSEPPLCFPRFHSTAVTHLVVVVPAALVCSSASSADEKVGVWSFDGELLHQLEVVAQVSCLAADLRLFAATLDQTIACWTLGGKQSVPVRSLTTLLTSRACCVSIGPRGQLLAGCRDGSLQALTIIELPSGAVRLQKTHRLEGHEKSISAIVIHGSRIFTASLDSTIKVW